MGPEFPIPTRADQYDFLQRLYFGPDRDPLVACVRRAYRDLNRTLHGVTRLPNSVQLGKQAAEIVRFALVELSASTVVNQSMFDVWHRDSCAQLCRFYADGGFPAFCVGQAQKWLNMVFKYVHVFGEERLPGFERLYRFGHVPVDRIMLRQLRPYGGPRLSAAWSRIQDYAEYIRFQNWIRQQFPDRAPLAVEFHLWLAVESSTPMAP